MSRFLVGLLASTAVLGLVPAVSMAGKIVDRIVAGSVSSGTTGGLFNVPRGVAVNASGAGNAAVGDVFVVDGANNRIQQFAANGSFVRAWGADVSVPAGGTTMETCTVAADCKAGVTTTQVGGAFNAPVGVAVDQGSGAVYVTDQGNRRVQKFTLPANPADPVVFDRAWGWDVTTGGVTTFEVCTVAADCKIAAAAGANGGQFAASQGHLTVVPAGNPNAGNVIVGDRTNRRVQEFEADGDFVRTFGWDVVPTGQPGDVGTDNFEICTSAATGACKVAAAAGTANGRFATAQPFHLVVDAGGVLYTSDSTNGSRVMRFDTGETTPAALLMPEISSSALGDSNATVGIAVDGAGHLLLARGSVFELASSGTSPTVVDNHYVGSGLAANGLAVAPGSGDIYMTSQTVGHQLFAADGDGMPAAIAAPADSTNVTTTTATLNGTVNPDSTFPVSYRFQYSADGVVWVSAGPATQLPAGSTPVAVSANVTGLEPNSFYRVRLVTQKPFGNPEQFTAEGIFLTDALAVSAPAVAGQVPAWVDQTEARLQAKINPGGLNTSYYFEYGTDPGDLDRRIPAEHTLFAGAGFKPVTVGASPSALDPETGYYFRVVASNSQGTTTGDLQPFETLNDQGLTQGRRFELVSPLDKGLTGEATKPVQGVGEHQSLPSPDGGSIAYLMGYSSSLAGAGEGIYRAGRGPAGWLSSEFITSPALGPVYTADGEASNGNTKFISSELECGFLTSPHLLTDDPAAVGVRDVGRWNLYRADAGGGYTLVPGVAPTNLTVPPSGTVVQATYVPVGAADDCSRVFFTTSFRYPGVPVTAGGFGDEALYEWDNGTLRSPGVIPSPSGPVVATGPVGVGALKSLANSDTGSPFVAGYVGRNVLSVDGSRFFFTATSQLGGDLGQRAVFMREDGQTGVDVSQSQTATANNGHSVFQKATPSGSHVFFTARYGLAANGSSSGATSCDPGATTPTNLGAGCDLYRYTAATGELVDLTPSSNPADSAGASVAGLLDASDDGSRAYFAAKGQLVAGKGQTYAQNDAADTRGYNVYLWDSGTLSYVATLPYSDVRKPPGQIRNIGVLATHPSSQEDHQSWSSQTTPSGGHLVFQSYADLTGYDSGGAAEAYRYSAATGALECVSCRRDGQSSVLPEVEMTQNTSKPVGRGYGQGASRYPLPLSEDGSRIFFVSYDPLAPGAVSGNKNLYEWHEGQITLLTTDLAKEQPNIEGNSTDGGSVFFRSDEAVLPWDTDGRTDLYVARVGGGFPAPSSPQACDPLAEGSCEGAAPQGPGALAAPTKGGAGDGDVDEGPRAVIGRVGVLSVAQRRVLARGGKARLRVSVSRAGVVRLAASARIGKRRRSVASATAKALSASVVGVRFGLSRDARAQLRRKGRLVVAIRVGFGDARAKVVQVRLTAPSARPAAGGAR